MKYVTIVWFLVCIVTSRYASSLKHPSKQWNDTIPQSIIEFIMSQELFDEKLTLMDIACWDQYTEFLTGVKNGSSWALHMQDAWGKEVSGALYGNALSFGQYEECLELKPPNFAVKYCIAGLYEPETPAKQILEKSRIPSVAGRRHKPPSLTQPPYFEYGVCVPSDCRTYMLEHILPIETYTGLLFVDPIDCSNVSTNPSLEPGFYIAVVTLLIVAATIIYSTLYEIFIENEEKEMRTKVQQVLTTFSIISNGRRLFNFYPKADTISALNGLMVLSMMWVLLGHRYWFMTTVPNANKVHVRHMFTEWPKQIILSAILPLDTFHFTNGLLNCYGVFKVMDSSKKFPILYYYLQRILRLTPALAAVILFQGFVFNKFTFGPIAHRYTSEYNTACQDNWWRTLVYISNYNTTLKDICVPQSWFISADMQMFLLAPIVLFPLWKWPLCGRLWCGMVWFASIAIQFVLAYVNQYKTPIPAYEEKNNQIQDFFFPTYTRFTPYVMGIVTGYLIYLHRNKKIKIKFHKAILALGWLICFGLLVAVMFIPYGMYHPSHEYHRLGSAMYLALYKVAWSLGLGWIVIACILGQGGLVDKVLSLPLFIPLAKLTYCIYLVHFMATAYFTITMRQPVYYMDAENVHLYFGDFSVSIICATILTLAFEAPVISLTNIFLQKPRKREPFITQSFIEDNMDIKNEYEVQGDNFDSNDSAYATTRSMTLSTFSGFMSMYSLDSYESATRM